MKPVDLVASVKASMFVVRDRLEKLAAAGTVTLTGATMSRLIHLGKPPAGAPAARATSTPKAPEWHVRNGVAPASEAIVKARDRAIVDALKVRARSEADLLVVLPPEAGTSDGDRDRALSSALIRLRVKKEIRQRDDGLWAIA